MYDLVGKFLAKRSINKKVLRSTQVKLWKTNKLFTILEIGANVFVIKFESQDVKMRVMQGRPWLFGSFLFVLNLFDGYIPPFKMDFSKEVFWVHLFTNCLHVRRSRVRYW